MCVWRHLWPCLRHDVAFTVFIVIFTKVRSGILSWKKWKKIQHCSKSNRKTNARSTHIHQRSQSWLGTSLHKLEGHKMLVHWKKQKKQKKTYIFNEIFLLQKHKNNIAIDHNMYRLYILVILNKYHSKYRSVNEREPLNIDMGSCFRARYVGWNFERCKNE